MNYLVNFAYWKSTEEEKFWKEILDFSTQSYKKYLKGSWCHYPIFQYEPIKHHDDIFYSLFCILHKLWQEGNNIFLVDTDTIAIREFEIFDMYNDLRMFWPTDPNKLGDLPIYFNRGTLYISKNTKKEIWELGFREWERYKQSPFLSWAGEQHIYNLMLYAQNLQPEEYLDNRYNFMPLIHNSIKYEEAYIIHYMTSRGAQKALHMMKENFK